MPSARLYTVQTLRGTVYAVHDLSSGTIWTERSEQAARQSALERRVSIIEEKFVSHDELLRLMGHEPPVASPAPKRSDPAMPVQSVEQFEDPAPSANPARPLSAAGIPVRYHWQDEADSIPPLTDDAIIIPRAASPSVKKGFFSEGLVGEGGPPVVDPDKAGDAGGPSGRPRKPG